MTAEEKQPESTQSPTCRKPTEGYGDGELCSVVVPVYLRARELARAVESVLSQTSRPLELIIVDDGSQPPLDLAVYASRCDSAHVRFVPLRQTPNSGPSSARNLGLQHASGEYVAFLDSDDAFLPSKLEKQMAVLRQSRGAAFVTSGYEALLEEGSGTEAGWQRRPEGAPELDRLLRFDPRLAITGPGVLYRSAAVRAVGGFDTRLAAVEEFDLMVRLLAHGGKGLAIQDVLLAVDHSSSLTHLSTDLAQQAAGRKEFLRKHAELLGVRPRALAENWLELGIILFRIGMRTRAVFALFRAMRVSPFRKKAWFYLACCCLPSLYWLALRMRNRLTGGSTIGVQSQ